MTSDDAPKPPPDRPSVVPDGREVLLRAAAGRDEMPSAIRALHAVDSLLVDPDLAANDRLDAIVQACEPLSGELVRLASGLSRASSERITDVAAIVTRSGLLGFRRMLEVVVSRNLFRASNPGIAEPLSQVWWHSLARAEAMRLVADRVEARKSWPTQTLYTAGLFADVGASFLLWLADQQRLPSSATGAPAPATLDLIADHHEWVGEDLLRRWGMPPDVARLAGNHHGRRSGVRTSFWPFATLACGIADEVVALPFVVANVREPADGAAHLVAMVIEERRHLILAVRRQLDTFRAALEGSGDGAAGAPH